MSACSTSTSTFCNGKPLRCAYMFSVNAVQAPNDAANKSCGVKPASSPPYCDGASAISLCESTCTTCCNLPSPRTTFTLLLISFSSHVLIKTIRRNYCLHNASLYAHILLLDRKSVLEGKSV